MPILNKCCCCIDLRTGGIILGEDCQIFGGEICVDNVVIVLSQPRRGLLVPYLLTDLIAVGLTVVSLISGSALQPVVSKLRLTCVRIRFE